MIITIAAGIVLAFFVLSCWEFLLKLAVWLVLIVMLVTGCLWAAGAYKAGASDAPEPEVSENPHAEYWACRTKEALCERVVLTAGEAEAYRLAGYYAVGPTH